VMLDTGYSMLDAGCWILDAGCGMLGPANRFYSQIRG